MQGIKCKKGDTAIEIYYENDIKDESRVVLLTEAILEGVKKFPFIKDFNSIKFYCVRIESDDIAIAQPPDRILINLEFIENNPSLNEQRKNVLIIWIHHEMAHLWHSIQSDVINKHEKVVGKLKGILENKNLEKSELRVTLNIFTRFLLIEGIAEFFAYSSPLSEKHFLYIYTLAESDANRFLREFELRKNDNKSLNFRNMVYRIGWHTVYTVYYLDPKMGIKKIAKMNPLEFIRLYEKLIIARGYKPLISLNSGKGIIDYKKLLEQIK